MERVCLSISVKAHFLLLQKMRYVWRCKLDLTSPYAPTNPALKPISPPVIVAGNRADAVWDELAETCHRTESCRQSGRHKGEQCNFHIASLVELGDRLL